MENRFYSSFLGVAFRELRGRLGNAGVGCFCINHFKLLNHTRRLGCFALAAGPDGVVPKLVSPTIVSKVGKRNNELLRKNRTFTGPFWRRPWSLRLLGSELAHICISILSTSIRMMKLFMEKRRSLEIGLAHYISLSCKYLTCDCPI